MAREQFGAFVLITGLALVPGSSRVCCGSSVDVGDDKWVRMKPSSNTLQLVIQKREDPAITYEETGQCTSAL